MRRLLLLASAAVLLGAARAPATRQAPSVPPAADPALSQPVDIDLRELPASELVGLLFDQVMRVPYVTSPAVNADRRSVSFRVQGTLGDARQQVQAYLEGLGYRFVLRGGVNQISVLPPPAPAAAPRPVRPQLRYFVYAPSWRDAADLGRTLGPLFPEGRFSAGGTSSAPALSSAQTDPAASFVNNPVQSGQASMGSSSSASMPATSSPADSLVFYGTAADIARLREVLPQVDTPQAEVMVKASVFEVDTAATDGSGLNLALSLLRTKLNIGFGSSSGVGVSAASALSSAASGGVSSALTGNFIQLSTNGIDAVIQALASDQRFRLVTAPTVRVRSGQAAQLVVGQQVPVLGSVAYTGSGSATPVQSVEYKNSGVILNARPYVRRSTIDLDLREEISSFIQTTSGVNSTPTLQQRTLSSSLSVQDGQVIATGGLTQSNDGHSSESLSFLPFIGSRQKTNQRTDILMILQLVRVNKTDGTPTGDELLRRAALPGVPAPVVGEAVR